MDAKTLVELADAKSLIWDLSSLRMLYEAADLIERQAAELAELRAERDALQVALGEIAWSNDSKWQSQRADEALNAARSGGGK